MALDARYIVAISLGEYIVDKDTGLPLAFGQIQFWKDDNRVDQKLVYQLAGAPPNYTYAPLPNPLFLNGAGLPVDDDGKNIAVYYFPYDDDGNIELYDVKCYSLGGVLQFERQGWPNITDQSNPANSLVPISNQISNPQFVDFLTSPLNTFTINYTGAASDSYKIAPDWNLVIGHTGDGTVTVTRNPIAGNLAYPNNPPFTLSITAGNNIESLNLQQTLLQNPNVFYAPVGSDNGYVATSLLLAPGSSASIALLIGFSSQSILSANNLGINYAEYKKTTKLNAPNNPFNPLEVGGSIIVSISLSVVGTTTLGNVQIVGISSDIENVPFEQTTSNRQRDQLFNFYQPLLSYKPLKSYLVGWDFYLNPAQALGPTVGPFATGANTSSYFWDQTIIFQATNNSIQTSRNSFGDLVVSSAGGGQFALIQYLPQNIARKILSGPCSVNILSTCGVAAGISGFVHLLYTTAGALPNMAANASIVATLNANGSLATANGAWTYVNRNGITAPQFSSFNLPFAAERSVPFSGFNTNNLGSSSATFFAIVVGFSALGAGDSISFKSISLVPGDIATIPAPQTQSEAYLDCRFYYRKSYNAATLPGSIGFSTGEYYCGITIGSPNNCIGAEVKFETPMYAPPTVTIYSPFSGLNQIATTHGGGADFTVSAAANITFNGFYAAGVPPGAAGPGDFMCYHWTARAQLGF